MYESTYFSEGIAFATNFKSLPEQVQVDLKTWYNRSELEIKEEIRLFNLVKRGLFHAWNCPECGERCYYGEPSNWDFFQGVWQIDYTSFPGNSEKFTQAYLLKLCDDCRMTL